MISNNFVSIRLYKLKRKIHNIMNLDPDVVAGNLRYCGNYIHLGEFEYKWDEIFRQYFYIDPFDYVV